MNNTADAVLCGGLNIAGGIGRRERGGNEPAAGASEQDQRVGYIAGYCRSSIFMSVLRNLPKFNMKPEAIVKKADLTLRSEHVCCVCSECS